MTPTVGDEEELVRWLTRARGQAAEGGGQDSDGTGRLDGPVAVSQAMRYTVVWPW